MHSSSTSNLFGFRILAVQKTEFFSYLDELIEKNQLDMTGLLQQIYKKQIGFCQMAVAWCGLPAF
jgi:hypothetical protein